MLKPIKYSIGLDHWHIFIEERSPGRWAVNYMGDCMNKDGKFEYEVSPSSRTDEYKEEYRFSSPEEAYSVFKEKANLVINGQKIVAL